MSSSADRSLALIDGVPASELARRLGVAELWWQPSVESTLDVAHARAAEGAAAGTLILADEQTAGRGRHGRRWTSAAGEGVWLTLIERPADVRAVDVLALRCGLFAAEALDALAGAPIGVKWPNDLYVGAGKLAGILIETRWRGEALDYVAIGFGLNLRAPSSAMGAGLRAGVTRVDALVRLVPALRDAAAAVGPLDAGELARWSARDIAVGRIAATPADGRVAGITTDGALVVDGAAGLTTHRSGSLTFAEALA